MCGLVVELLAQTQLTISFTATGTANAIVGNPTYVVTSYAAMASAVPPIEACFLATASNTGATTLAISGHAAKAVVTGVSTALAADTILAGQYACVKYNAANDNFQLSTSAVSGGGSGIAITTTTASTSTTTHTFTRSSAIHHFKLTLEHNLASTTLSGPSAGDVITFEICQDGTGGRTIAWPAGFTKIGIISATASKCSQQTIKWDGSAAIPLSAMTSDDPGFCLAGATAGCTNLLTSTTGSGTVIIEAGTYTVAPKTVDGVNAPTFAADAGASDTYVATLAPVPTSYVTGNRYRFKANTANTGAATVNFNSLGAITIVKVAGGITTALADNDIRAGQWVDLTYDGTNMQMASMVGNAAASGSNTWTAVQAIANKTAGGTWLRVSTDCTIGGGTTTDIFTYAQMDNAGACAVVASLPLDARFTSSGTITVRAMAQADSTADYNLVIDTACTGAGDTITPSYNASSNANGAMTGSTLRLITVSTIATSGSSTCASGKGMSLRIKRGTDTPADLLYLHWIDVTQ